MTALSLSVKHIALNWRRSGLPEATCWVLGMLALVLMDPAGAHLFSLCPLSWVLEAGCPGCGLGHSIAFLFRGDWQASWEAHPLGVPALLILGWRIIILLRQHYHLNKHSLKP
jgi:hypothetical protein